MANVREAGPCRLNDLMNKRNLKNTPVGTDNKQ